MATYLLVSALIVLVFVLLYPLFQNRGVSKKRALAGAGRPGRQAAIRPPSRDLSSSEGADHPVDSPSFPAACGAEEAAQDSDAWMRSQMALTFSGVQDRQDDTTALLRIDGVADDVRQRVVFHIASLKNFDTLCQLQRIMGDPKTTMANLSLMITSNPLLSAKILQVANSAYYGMEQKLNSISHAIMIIGMVNLKAIIYHEAVLQALKEQSFRDNPTMQAIWQHANYTSIYASYLHYLFGGLNMGNLFTLGLLHDIGKFIMMSLTPLSPGNGGMNREYSPNWTVQEEEEVYGINHALVGRMALQHWGLSRLIVETVALHHAPVSCSPEELGLDHDALQYLLVMFLADQAARLFAGRGGADARVDFLHPAYHCLIDRNRLSQLIVDKSLMAQLREAEAITGVYA